MSPHTSPLAPTAGPLAGIRVIECGSLIAGPFCGQLLADFGAQVIKVEDPSSGDPMRTWRMDDDGNSLSWPIIARNKKSITCNLRDPEGQDLLRRLIATADVVVENFRPGTLERWGLDYQTLSRTNPGLILVRVTGYGQSGPYANRAGFGSIGEAMGGIRYMTGEPDRPPSRVGVSLGDSLAGTFAAFGAVTALVSREGTERGQIVDAAIYEAVLALMESLIPEWEVTSRRRERSGALLPGVAPSSVYPTSDNAEILIAGNRDTVFERLCRVMGRPDLASDARYATHTSRGLHQEELDRIIADWTRGLPAEHVLTLMHEAGVPAGRIFTAEDMLTDPHYAARNAIVRMTHDRLGTFPMQNVFPKLSETPGSVNWTGPALGQHNEEIYGEQLALSDDERSRLHTRGVI